MDEATDEAGLGGRTPSGSRETTVSETERGPGATGGAMGRDDVLGGCMEPLLDGDSGSATGLSRSHGSSESLLPADARLVQDALAPPVAPALLLDVVVLTPCPSPDFFAAILELNRLF